VWLVGVCGDGNDRLHLTPHKAKVNADVNVETLAGTCTALQNLLHFRLSAGTVTSTTMTTTTQHDDDYYNDHDFDDHDHDDYDVYDDMTMTRRP